MRSSFAYSSFHVRKVKRKPFLNPLRRCPKPPSALRLSFLKKRSFLMICCSSGESGTFANALEIPVVDCLLTIAIVVVAASGLLNLPPFFFTNSLTHYSGWPLEGLRRTCSRFRWRRYYCSWYVCAVSCVYLAFFSTNG